MLDLASSNHDLQNLVYRALGVVLSRQVTHDGFFGNLKNDAFKELELLPESQ
jgi:hypothetical protein